MIAPIKQCMPFIIPKQNRRAKRKIEDPRLRDTLSRHVFSFFFNAKPLVGVSRLCLCRTSESSSLEAVHEPVGRACVLYMYIVQ